MAQPSSRTQPISTPNSRMSTPQQPWWFDRQHTNVFGSSPLNQSPGCPNPCCMERIGSPNPQVAIPLPAPGDEMRFREDWGLNQRHSGFCNRTGFADFSIPERILTANFSALNI